MVHKNIMLKIFKMLSQHTLELNQIEVSGSDRIKMLLQKREGLMSE